MKVFVGLHRGGGAMGRAIRVASWSPYGHASLRFGDMQPSDVVFEADVKEGFRAKLASEVIGKVTWFEVPSLTRHQRMRALIRAHNLLGTKYDTYGVIRFLPLIRMFYSGPAFKTGDRIFCSEAVFMILESVGLPLLARLPAHKVEPGMLAFSPYLVEVPEAA
jgi:hypothetical protein